MDQDSPRWKTCVFWDLRLEVGMEPWKALEKGEG